MRPNRWILSAIIAVAAVRASARAEDQMPWQPNLETARQIAAQTNRLVLIHFWAPRCEPCMRVEKEVFSRPETARALEANFVLVKLNAWDDAPGTARLYGVSTLPTDVIIAPSGRLVSQIQSPIAATQYVAQMNQAAAGYRELVRNSTQQVASASQSPPAATSAATAQPAAPSASSAALAAPYNSTAGVTPAAATAPIAPAAPAATATAGFAANSAAGSAPAAQSVAPQPPVDDRYADYYRQHPEAAPQGVPAQAAPPQNMAPPQAAPQQQVVAPQQQQYAPQQQATAPPAGVTSPAASYVAPQPAGIQAQAAPPMNVAPQNPSAGSAAPPAAPASVSPYTASGPSPQAYTAAAPQQPPVQLPPGCPPAGLYGYCPVTLVESKQWALGDRAYGAVHRGRTYLFLGPAEKEKFLANPDRYCPVLSGNDPVLAMDNQVVVAGRRETGVFGPDGRIYLFADESSLARFNQNPKRYAAEAVQAMR